MPHVVTISNNSAQAGNPVQLLKSLNFVDVKERREVKVTTVVPKVLEEDEDGMPLAYKDPILDLSKRAKKTAAKQFYERVADDSIL